MELAVAEQVAAVIGDIREIEKWIHGLDMQDTARSRNIEGFMSEIFGGLSEETTAEIRGVIRRELVSRLVRYRQTLTKLGVTS